MTRKLKALGLALVAVFALSAVAAQGAFAAEEFHSEAKETVVTAEQQAVGGVQILEIEGGLKVECSKFTAEGLAVGKETVGPPVTYTSPELTVGFKYSGSPSKGGAKCDSFLGAESVEVKSNECHYDLKAETVKEGHALVNVTCPKGKSIEIIGGGLVLKITGGPENLFGGAEVNKNLTGVHYTNTGTGPGREVTVNATVSGIHYTCEPEFTCFLAGVPNTGNTAKYTGLSTAKGFVYAGGSTGAYKEGNQVGIWKE